MLDIDYMHIILRKAGRGRVSAGKFIRSVLEKLNVPVKNNRKSESDANYTDLDAFYTELNLWHTCFILTQIQIGKIKPARRLK